MVGRKKIVNDHISACIELIFKESHLYLQQCKFYRITFFHDNMYCAKYFMAFYCELTKQQVQLLEPLKLSLQAEPKLQMLHTHAYKYRTHLLWM